MLWRKFVQCNKVSLLHKRNNFDGVLSLYVYQIMDGPYLNESFNEFLE